MDHQLLERARFQHHNFKKTIKFSFQTSKKPPDPHRGAFQNQRSNLETTSASRAGGEVLTRGASLAHHDVAPVQRLSIPQVDGLLGLLICGHFDKSKPLRSARGAIHDNRGGDNRARLCEGFLETFVVGVVGNTSDK